MFLRSLRTLQLFVDMFSENVEVIDVVENVLAPEYIKIVEDY